MGVAAILRLEAQPTLGVWTNLTPYTVQEEGLHLHYGVEGTGPIDLVAGSGELSCVLHTRGTQGLFSPLHANVLSGWTFGIPIQAVFRRATDTVVSVSSITRSGTTATATTPVAHGRTSGDYVTIDGVTQPDYNGTRKILVTGATTFTFTVLGSATTPATGTITAVRSYVKFRGKIHTIDPEPGEFRSQRVRITAYDIMHDLMDAAVREVTLQVNKTETELITALVDAVPAAAQPIARDFDTAADNYPVAFDDVDDSTRALSAISDVAISALALVSPKGDGTLMVRTRHSRLLEASAYTFDNSMHGLRVPTAPSFDRVRVTIHPKVVSAAATDELYTLPADATLVIPAGETIGNLFTEYSDPNDRQTSVGGVDVIGGTGQPALVAGTHYAANSAEDGSGSDLTGDITPTIEPFATTARWTLENTGSETAYIRTLKVIGKAVRDPGPQTFQGPGTTGTRPLDVDMPYQDDPQVGQDVATFLETQSNAGPEVLDFLANDSAAFLTQFLEREPGDVITTTEPVTGLSVVKAAIQRVSADVSQGTWIATSFGLSAALTAPWVPWQLEVAGASELESTTTLGL